MTPTNDVHEDTRADSAASVGTVAEEAARLVDLLGSLGVGSPDPEPDAEGARGEEQEPTPEPQPAPEPQPEPQAAPEPQPDPRSCTCGGQRPAACEVCPVCQLIAFVQRVSPETIDRLAEVVELAATGLRDLAVVQRARRGEQERATPPGGPTPTSGGSTRSEQH